MKYFFIIIFIFKTSFLFAHQTSNSVLILDIKEDGVLAELKLPIYELQFALNKDLSGFVKSKASNKEKFQLSNYILNHIQPVSNDGTPWKLYINNFKYLKSDESSVNMYNVLIVEIWMVPTRHTDIRRFTLNYDVIINKVTNHKVFVSIRQDWLDGKVVDSNNQIAILGLNEKTNKVPPLKVNLSKGSLWKGFKAMVNLGMEHIAEGFDHLLFLLVLLLSAPLVAKHKRWEKFGGLKYSILRLVKIATSFTVGHSSTLIFGALGWIKLPQEPVEIMICITIFITALHAIRPIFPNKETYIGVGFGLIHGLAFASTISDLNLNTFKMVISIFGFNIGIEIMQIIVVLVVVPLLLFLSKTRFYIWFRISLAYFGLLVSIGLIVIILFD